MAPQNTSSFETPQAQAGKGVKLSSKDSKFAPKLEAKQAAVELDNTVSELQARKQMRQQEIFELGKQLIAMFKDQTVPENKTTTTRSLEAETLQKLINFGIEVNADELETEGMGSITLLTLVFKTLLMNRDKNNLLECEIARLKQEMSKLKQLAHAASKQE